MRLTKQQQQQKKVWQMNEYTRARKYREIAERYRERNGREVQETT